MSIALAVILAASLSIDAMGVGLSYGMQRIAVPMRARIIMSCCSFAYALVAMLTGSALKGLVPDELANWIGAGILAVLGGVMMFKEVRAKRAKPQERNVKETLVQWSIKSLGLTVKIMRNPALADMDGSRHIDIVEALFLGLALSLDALGAGIGVSLASGMSLLQPLLIGLSQLLFLSGGLYIGLKLSEHAPERLQRVLAFCPGALLIALALVRVI